MRRRRWPARGAKRAEIEEAARKRAEVESTPEHLVRPPNPWRELIELRKADGHRADVARRLKIYEREAKVEDEQIDKLMEEKARRHDLESAPEYAKALGHWDRASAAAENDEERQEWSRLKGLIEGGGASQYWDEVAPIMQGRLQKVRADAIANAAKQWPLDEEAAAIAEKEKATAELQVKEEPRAEPT